MKYATFNDGNGNGNSRSCLVIGELARLGYNVTVFESLDQLDHLDPETVMLFDWNRRVNNFSPVQITPQTAPGWAGGARAGVQIGEACVAKSQRIARAARQLAEMFERPDQNIQFKRFPKGRNAGNKQRKRIAKRDKGERIPAFVSCSGW